MGLEDMAQALLEVGVTSRNAGGWKAWPGVFADSLGAHWLWAEKPQFRFYKGPGTQVPSSNLDGRRQH